MIFLSVQPSWECTWGYIKVEPKDALISLHKDTSDSAFEVALEVALELRVYYSRLCTH